jgi:heat shock protein HtpX
MATLYTQKTSNIVKTWLYLTLFFFLIIGIGWVISYYYNDPAILVIATIFSVVTSVSSYWFSDKIVLSITKAKEIKHDENPELYHIVENLCITAGLPVPKIYIIEEQQPNAFATGRDAKHAVIAVTRGLLDKLEKIELEGVIAHELSHIGNKDILLSTIVVILAGLIANVSNIFIRMSFFGGNRDNNSRGSGGALFAILGLVAIILAPIAAKMIQLAVSRKREFLADSSGALLTRYPEGLAKALEKIASDPNPLKVAGNSTAHLFISSPFRGKEKASWFTKLFSTHPPAEERIKILRGMDM